MREQRKQGVIAPEIGERRTPRMKRNHKRRGKEPERLQSDEELGARLA